MTENAGVVLLVDDDKFAGRMAELNFENNGFQVVVAESGEAALDSLSRADFDVVIADMVMPGMSGLDLVRALRKTHAKHELPAIVLSGHSQPEKVIEAFEAGANDFVTKSNAFDLLVARAANQVSLKRAYAQSGDTPLQRGADALWSWNLKTDSVNYSARWAAALGLDKQALSDSPGEWLDRVHPDDAADLKAAIEMRRARKSGWLDVDFRIRHAKLGYRWAHVFGVALFGKDGAALRMLGSLSLWEPSARLDRLQDKLAALEEGLRALGQDAALGDDQRARLQSLLTVASELRAETGAEAGAP